MTGMTRRRFLEYSAAAGATILVPLKFGVRTARALTLPTLDHAAVGKYVLPLVVPPAMPATGTNSYEIAVRQFSQRILPEPYPATTVWSYGSAHHPASFHYPAFTIEARHGTPTRVEWRNELVDGSGRYLPHLLPVDPTLHWANPPGGTRGRDMRPEFLTTPGAYTGPVPIVTHVHGAHVPEDSDGYPEAWYLPHAKDIPPAHARFGTWYTEFRAKAAQRLHQGWRPGTAVFEYPNDQRATTLWYHDHTLGMTRLNVYAGPAGFYLVRGGPDDLPAGVLPGPPAYEIPIAIQDRSFNADGSLFYPDSREYFDGIDGPYVPDSDVSPIWNPEFFGHAMVVNGKAWPYLNVEPRRYRLRFLNGCNSRFLILKLVGDPQAARPASPTLPFWQIGAEGGFLPEPVELGSLLMAPAERADVIVDFGGLPVGTELYLINEGPDEPFGGDVPNTDFPAADPATTGQVMKFVVGPSTGADATVPPAELELPALTPLGDATHTRQLSLNELMSMHPGLDGPAAALLGLVADGEGLHREWADPVTETPAVGATEVWELWNFTEDAHPIHVHQVMFEVLDRQPFEGAARGPESWETGPKDTVIAFPDEITRIKARFDLAGLYVWHCHIVEHEDNEMMRPYRVG